MDQPIMQRENEHRRVVVAGTLADGGGRCTVIAVLYRSPRRWVFYPHGMGRLGVELTEAEATTLARGIVDPDR